MKKPVFRTLTLIFLAIIAAVGGPALAQEENDDAAALALFDELFAVPPSRMLKQAEAHQKPCHTVRMLQMYSFLEKKNVSPYLRQGILDVLSVEGLKPVFPGTLESKHFTVRYTETDLISAHNISAAKIQPFLTELDAYYDKYLKVFRTADPKPPAKIFLDIYDYSINNPSLAEALAFTSPDTFAVNILPSTFNESPCLVRHVLAHELFHRIELARGLREHITEYYWVEGMAEWGTLYINPKDNIFIDYVQDVFSQPYQSQLNRTYDGALFWIYLDERYKELNGKRGAGKIIDLFLSRAAKTGEDTALSSAIPRIVGDLAKADELKSKRKRPRGVSPYAFLAQDWHIANLYTALNVRDRRLGYDAYPVVDACGTARSFVPLGVFPSEIQSDNDSLTGENSVLALSATYYSLNIGPQVSRLNVEVKATRSDPVAVSAIGVKGTKARILKSGVAQGLGKGFKETLKFKKGSFSAITIVIGGYDVDALSVPYIININRGAIDLTGSWNFTGEENAMQVVEGEGGAFIGDYSGVGTHSALQGRLVGKIEDGVWKGTFSVVENNVFGQGTFELKYNAGPPETLIGSITAHNNFDPVDRTNPISFTKKP